MANKYELRRRALKDGGSRGENAYGSARRGKRGEETTLQGYTPPPAMDRRGLTIALCLGLVVLISLLYVQTARHQFTVCDDNVYIYEKPQIISGLTWENVKWAFQDAHEGNWHPLTWISHMLDWQLFSHGSWEPENQRYKDSWAGGHHLMNMFLHCANAVLLFLALRLMTGTLWPSFVVAVLFAAHPLRVESVAWAAERKDVLCGLFWMASMLTYAMYVRRPPLSQSTPSESLGTIGLYLLLNVFMGLGLMAKSMIVTLPAVLLLLDVWPLYRWKNALWPPGSEGQDIDLFRGLLLLLEKAPLFALAFGDSMVTIYGQNKGVALNSFEGLPLSVRLLNAVESCGEYLRQTFWPTGLAPFYAHPHMIPNGFTHEFYVKFWIYSWLLLAISVLSAIYFVRRPYLAVGWLWFLGALMPVIGIIQVGTQARADRYTYLPMIGFYIMVAWLLKEVADRWPHIRPLLAAGGAIVLAAMSAVTFLQVSYWINSYKLFEHAVAVTDNNYFAYNHIGIAYDKDGKELARTDPVASQAAFDHSAEAFKATLAIKPDYDFGNNNLGVYYAREGKSFDSKSAEKFFRGAIVVNPRYADAFNNLGIILAQQGNELIRQGKLPEALAKLDDSAAQHLSGLQVRYDRASDHNNLCRVYLQMSLVHKALQEKAQQAHDSDTASHEGDLEARDLKRALQEVEIALACDQNFVGAWQARADILRQQKKLDEMAHCYERIIEIDPKAQEAVMALQNLLIHYDEQKKPDVSIELLDKTADHYTQAVAGKPLSVEMVRMPLGLAIAYNNLKQSDKASHWLDQAGEIYNQLFRQIANPQDTLSERFNVALLYVRLQQPDKAIAWLNQILKINPAVVEAYAIRNVAYEMKGDLPDAQADYNLVAKSGVPERFHAAARYLDVRQPDKAIALLTQILTTNGGSVDAYELRAAAFMQKRDFASAKSDYEILARNVSHDAPQYPGILEKLKAVNDELAKPPGK